MLLAGVIGDPISHSLSPKLHGFWLERYGIKGAYIPMHVKGENLEQALRALPSLGFGGCNVTVPHKEAVMPYLDKISPEAKKIGAVNTIIVQKNGKLHGTNTDAFGFIENVKSQVRDLTPYLEQVLVIGAGGAARAIIYGLLQEGANKILIANRTAERAESLAAHFGKKCEVIKWEALDTRIGEVTMLVNSTTLGMKGQPALELPLRLLSKNALVSDIVYAPLTTSLLQKAKRRGNPTVDGIGMLLHQARPGFEAWFGKAPKVDKALIDYMRKQI